MSENGRLRIDLFDREGDIYCVTFLPDYLEHPGEGAVGYEKLRGLEGVQRHLRDQSIDEGTMKKAVRELRQHGRCIIPHVSSDC